MVKKQQTSHIFQFWENLIGTQLTMILMICSAPGCVVNLLWAMVYCHDSLMFYILGESWRLQNRWCVVGGSLWREKACETRRRSTRNSWMVCMDSGAISESQAAQAMIRIPFFRTLIMDDIVWSIRWWMMDAIPCGPFGPLANWSHVVRVYWGWSATCTLHGSRRWQVDFSIVMIQRYTWYTLHLPIWVVEVSGQKNPSRGATPEIQKYGSTRHITP